MNAFDVNSKHKEEIVVGNTSDIDTRKVQTSFFKVAKTLSVFDGRYKAVILRVIHLI